MGDDLAAFVNRTVTNAYATAAELEAASARGGEPSARYPETRLAKRLELVARSIKAGSTARVFYVIQPGYDSHAVQLPAQAQLLREFTGAVKAFLDDLAASKLADRVVLLAFSEFGRRPRGERLARHRSRHRRPLLPRRPVSECRSFRQDAVAW